MPRRVSRSEPTGIWRAAVSGTNRRPLIPGTDTLANAEPAGTLTNTLPLGGRGVDRLAHDRGRQRQRVDRQPNGALAPVIKLWLAPVPSRLARPIVPASKLVQ